MGKLRLQRLQEQNLGVSSGLTGEYAFLQAQPFWVSSLNRGGDEKEVGCLASLGCGSAKAGTAAQVSLTGSLVTACIHSPRFA